jgi:hypothetical protein
MIYFEQIEDECRALGLEVGESVWTLVDPGPIGFIPYARDWATVTRFIKGLDDSDLARAETAWHQVPAGELVASVYDTEVEVYEL